MNMQENRNDGRVVPCSVRRNFLSHWTTVLFVILAFGAVAARLSAQAGATGTVVGTVTDATGAFIPNANVTVKNTQTGAVVRTSTSSSGDYQASSLNPGTYSVSAEMKGFEKTVTSAFALDVDQKVRVNVQMKLGAVTETVEVDSQALGLDTDSSEIGQLVSQKQVEELPLNGRNFMQLLLLGAGAVTVGGEQGTMRQGSGNAISINGARPESNNYTLDGLINTDTALVTPAVILSQDAIQEFKVESGSYPAEFGFSANQINLVSKSGTNNIHGAIFEFDRNNAFDAKPLRLRRIIRRASRLRCRSFGKISSALWRMVRSEFRSSTTAGTRRSGWPTTKVGGLRTAS